MKELIELKEKLEKDISDISEKLVQLTSVSKNRKNIGTELIILIKELDTKKDLLKIVDLIYNLK